MSNSDPIGQPIPRPDLPPPTPGGLAGGPAEDAAVQASRNAIMTAEAIGNIGETTAVLQTTVEQLQADIAKNAEQIARHDAAIRAHACPTGTQIPNANSREGTSIASIGECINAGLCGCEVGFALTGATWAPT